MIIIDFNPVAIGEKLLFVAYVSPDLTAELAAKYFSVRNSGARVFNKRK